MKIIQVNNFSGGINNYLSPKHMPENKMRELTNGIGDTFSLRPAQAPKVLDEYDSIAELNHYGWSNRSAVKWYNRYYWSINDAGSAPYYSGNVESLGVAFPEDKPTVTATTGTLTGSFKYAITFLNESLWESAPGSENTEWWTTVELTEEGASITLPATIPDTITRMRIYRTVNEGSEFFFISEHLAAEVGDAITDDKSDIDLLLNNPLTTINTLPPPNNGKYLTERNGVFFVAVANVLYVSEQSNPHAWNPTNWIGFDSDITGITKEYNGILVFTANKSYRITGYDINTLAKQEIPGQQGCVNYRTIATAGTAPAWVSNDGICIWNGNEIQIVTKQQINFDGTPLYAIAANDRYYLFFDTYILVFDIRAGGVFRTMTMDPSPDYAWYDADTDNFYLADVQESQKILIRLLESGANLTMRYLSGIIPADGASLKNFKRISIDANGSVSILIKSDNNQQQFNKILLGSGKLQLFFPAGFFARGVSVQLESSSEIYSYLIEYEEIGI